MLLSIVSATIPALESLPKRETGKRPSAGRGPSVHERFTRPQRNFRNLDKSVNHKARQDVLPLPILHRRSTPEHQSLCQTAETMENPPKRLEVDLVVVAFHPSFCPFRKTTKQTFSQMGSATDLRSKVAKYRIPLPRDLPPRSGRSHQPSRSFEAIAAVIVGHEDAISASVILFGFSFFPCRYLPSLDQLPNPSRIFPTGFFRSSTAINTSTSSSPTSFLGLIPFFLSIPPMVPIRNARKKKVSIPVFCSVLTYDLSSDILGGHVVAI